MGTGSDCNEHICSNDKEEKQLKEIFSKPLASSSSSRGSVEKPLNAGELGRSTWPLLHRMTLSYPEQPTPEQ